MTSPLVYVLIAPLFLVCTTPLPADVAKPAAQLIRNAVPATAEKADAVVITVQQTIEVEQEDDEDDIEINTEATPNITDPGCVEKQIYLPEQGYVLTSCEELCGGDQILPERDNRSCVVVNETYPEENPKEVLLGVCVRGDCVPKEPKSIIHLAESGTTEESEETEPEETLPVNTAEPSAPKCDNVTFIANNQETVVRRCEELCGDAVVMVPDNTTCIHETGNGVPDVTGICQNGKCVLVRENPEKGPADSCEKHRITVGNETIYLQCSYPCETDEVMSIPNGEQCVLSGNISEHSPDNADALTVGVCHDRVCVPRNISTEETTAYTTALPAEGVPEADEQSGTVFKSSCYENVIYVPGKGNVLTLCDETCEGDEVLLLGDSKLCAVINETYPNGSKLITLGGCAKGFCQLYNPAQTVILPKNSTTEVVTVAEEEGILLTETEQPSRPECENVSLIANGKEMAVMKCTDACGDEMRIIKDNTSCIHHSSVEGAEVFGKCRSGDCVLETENPKKGPKDRCSTHQTSVNNETLYLRCTYFCEMDEVITLRNGESCYIPESDFQPDSHSPKYEVGVCLEGECVKHNDSAVVDNSTADYGTPLNAASTETNDTTAIKEATTVNVKGTNEGELIAME